MDGPGGVTLVLLDTPALLPAGLLTREAWALLAAGPVLTDQPAHPQLAALREQGIEVSLVAAAPPAEQWARLAAAAAATGTASWLSAGPADPVALSAPDLPAGVVLLRVQGGRDPVGAQLLAAVTVMDRLRSPGGCPWDAEQTHTSLAAYLLEEAYEAVEVIEQGDLDRGLREELGDVLLQVLFHARVAAERLPQAGFDVDAVAGDLVAKLTRRHPHVFGSAQAPRGASDVEASWERLKQQEKQRQSVLDGIPTGQPALAYAAAVLRRAARAGLPIELGEPAAPDPAAGADDPAAGADDPAAWGRRLLALAASSQAAGTEPEQALRAANRALAEAVRRAETARRAEAAAPPSLST